MKRFIQFMNPSVNPEAEKEMNITSLKSIRMIALIALVFEILAAVMFFVSIGWQIDNNAIGRSSHTVLFYYNG